MEINSCSSCGGRIEYSPKHKALLCVNCGNVYNVEFKHECKKHPIGWTPDINKLNKWSTSNKSYECKTCGAQITFNKFDIANNCQYCNTSSLMPLKDLPGLMPEIVIPFKIAKNNAKSEFYTRIKKRKFLPLAFKKNLPKTDIGATYISSFTFACDVTATYNGTRTVTKTVRGSDGKSRTVTEYESFSGKIEKYFDNIAVEASDKLSQDEITEIYPYNFAESYDYDDDFVKGYNVGYYNQSVEDAEYTAKKEALEDIERSIRSKYSSIVSLKINPTYSNVVYNYALLPVYFINFNYKNKQYTNVMNGQTGVLAGKVPRSALQITGLTLFIIAVIVLFGLGIFLML